MARPASAMRGHILDSALRLFATNGFGGTSLHAIAADASCSKASLIYHFSTKEAILTELLTPAGEGLAALDGQLNTLPDEERVAAAVTGYVDLALRYRREVKILFEDTPAMICNPALGDIEALAARLATAMSGGSADPRRVVSAHMVLGAVFITCASELDVPDEVLRDELVAGALRTLGHRAG
ncbi:TetR family transcriptional regulator [Streptomyces sp. NBC_00237]|uniref:TetR/AcrR family transcriptional regulator n=1 Tax=Streptomyces sp. NBC_00237 TaxID=2975687 RepID=UPI00225162EF|nr:TetR family transcriptional regulator [Streptomyces sp. NBC_00237]MCX5205362.1 TetR family transcriptional regulator [Streptomyces sp. NBC_00237]